MLKKPFLAIVLLALLTCAASADDASKKAKLDKFIDVLGLRQSYAAANVAQLEQTRKAMDPVIKKMFDEIDDADIRARIEKSFKDYREKIAGIFDTNASVDALSASIGKRLSEDDLEQLLKFYLSDLGGREIVAMRESLVEYSQTLGPRRAARAGQAMNELREDIARIVTVGNEKPAPPEKDGGKPQ